MAKRAYSSEERKARAFRRAALALHSYWEESSGAHSRLFETLIPDEFVICGRSVKGGDYREHVVPCALIRDRCRELFDEGRTVEDVAKFIAAHLKIAFITPEEAEHLNVRLGFKTKMPDDWKFGDDVMARLIAADIKLAALAARD